MRGTVHTPGTEAALAALGMAARVADVERPETLDGIGDGIDYVLDLHGGRRADPDDVARLNVAGTRNLIEALRGGGIEKFVRTNTNSLYGEAGDEWVTEDRAPQPNTPIGQVSYQTHLVLDQAYREHGFPAVELRLPAILNPGRGQLEEARRGSYPMLGDGTAWKVRIYVEDLIDAIILAAERGQPGEAYNICDEPLRAIEYYRQLAAIAGGPDPVPGRSTGAHGYAALQALANQSLRLSNEKARRELGWAPRHPTALDGLRALREAEQAPRAT